MAAAASRCGSSTADRPRREVGGHPGQLELVEHVDELVADRLERGDGPVELHPVLGVLGGHLEGPVAGADALGAQRDADVVDTRCRSARWSPGGPIRRAGRPPSSSRATLRVTSMVGTSSPRGRVEGEGRPGRRRRGPPRRRGRRCGRRARAAWCPRGPTCRRGGGRWPRSRRADRGARPPRGRRWRGREPSASRGSTSRVAEPRRHERRRHRRRQPRTGQRAAGPSPRRARRPRASRARRRRARSGTSTPVQPSSANWRQRSSVNAAVVVEHRPHVGGADLAVEERARGGPQRLLLLAEREVHGRGR